MRRVAFEEEAPEADGLACEEVLGEVALELLLVPETRENVLVVQGRGGRGGVLLDFAGHGSGGWREGTSREALRSEAFKGNLLAGIICLPAVRHGRRTRTFHSVFAGVRASDSGHLVGAGSFRVAPSGLRS